MKEQEFEGFIIYPTYRVEEGKSYVYLFGRLKNGKSFCTKNFYKPFFYIKEEDLKKAEKIATFEKENIKLKTFKEENLIKIIKTFPKEVPELRKLFEESGIECYEADVRFSYRFMMENKLKGSLKIKGTQTKNDSLKVDYFFEEPQISSSEWKPSFKDLKILSIDIESSMDLKTLYCISMVSNDKELNKVLIVSEKEGLKHSEKFKTEKELLEKFKEELIKYDPDIITGWNLIDFDLKLIEEKMKRLGLVMNLGRNDEKISLKIYESFMTDSKADVPGRVVLDGIHVLKTSFIKLDDYKLGTAAEKFTKEKKLIGDDNKGEEIETSYKKNQQKLIDYNLLDSKLVLEILENSGAIQLTIQRSMLTGMPLDRVRASIASLDSLYIRELAKRGYAAPSAKYVERNERTTGGFVMNPKPGIYNYVIVCDFKSLYPSLMRTFNIDPLKYRPGCQKIGNEELIKAPNGACFTKEPGILPEILQKLWAEREKARKNKDELSRWAIKILMNSMYGVIASPNCRFYSFEVANAITSFGHKMIKDTTKLVEEKGYKVIYGDSVGGETNVIVKEKSKIYEAKISDLFIKTDKISDSKKEYDFKKDLKILTLDEKGNSVFKSVFYVMRHKCNKKMYRVNFTNNWSIDVTEDHSLIGYQSAAFNNSQKNKENVLNRLIEIKPEEIKKKANSIVTLRNIPNNNQKSKNYPVEVYEFMGYFVGDGSFMRNNAHKKADKDYYLRLSLGKDVNEVLDKMIKPLIKKEYIKGYWHSKTRKGDLTINGLKLIKIITNNFRSKKGKKIIPEWLLYEKDENIRAFLRGLFSADGCVMVRNNAPIIKFTSIYDEYIAQVRKMLYFVGISHSVFKENSINKYKVKNKTYSSGSQSKNIILKDKEKFAQEIGFLLERKSKLSRIKTNSIQKKDVKNYGFDLQQVKSVELISKQDYVYDVEVKKNHRFFANYVLVHNTDSIFIDLNINSVEEAEKIGNQIQDEINNFYDKEIKKVYGVKSYLELEFEKTYKKFLMPKVRGSEAGAKKRYAGLLMKGKEEKMEFTGLEFVRRDWTELSKKFQLELFDLIFHDKEIGDYVKDFVANLKKGKYDDLLVYRKALRKDVTEYTKTTPPHVKAARLLDKITSNIIDYVITVDGPEPIQKLNHSIDYEHYIDKQIKPIAESVLFFYKLTFEDVVKGSQQKDLFDY